MRRYINKHIESYVEYNVGCVLKLLTTTNCVRYIGVNPKCNLAYSFNFSKSSYFLELIEIDITFLR